MYKHHQESIAHMITHYRENPQISALFLVGSVATGTARADSDLDGVAIVPQAYCDALKSSGKGLEEVYHGKCTYEGGYFNIHYMTREQMLQLAESGSEPMRNLFSCARVLFCDESQADLPAVAQQIATYPVSEMAAKQLRYYCTFKQFHRYFWVICKPEGFMRHHVAGGMVFNLYRLVLIENQILFPSMRKLEEFVIRADRKPDGLVEMCRRFMETLADEDAAALIDCYESWTAYDFPKASATIINNFANPLEWQ